MVRSTIMRIVLVAACVLILIGVALMTWMLLTEEERNVIDVDIDGGKIKFENLAMLPGESCEYKVRLKGDRAKKYDLNLNFVELEEKTLKNYARVRIEADGEIICDELLVTVFEAENINLPVDFSEGKNTELKITYYLPIDIGNEAKNAEAIFELRFESSNE